MLSSEVRGFVTEHIHSVVQLETLLLLCRQREQQWTAEAVARELRIDRGAAAAELADLQLHGLVALRGSSYVYAPRAARAEQIVAELAAAYEDQRVAVINLIYSKPSDRIRVFADAFRLRKDEDEDG